MSPTRLIILATLFSTGLKFWWAAASDGSNDVMLFYLYARAIQEKGLLGMYGPVLFNHTPLVGWFAGAIYEMTGGAGRGFAFWLRAPGIVADLVTVLSLLWLRRKTGVPPWWVLALFALSPVSLMVTGYHGNVDPLLVCALTLAVCCCVGGRPGWSGFALGMACQVKVIALFAAPALAFWWWEQKRARPFIVAAAVTVLAGWSWPLMNIPATFLNNVIAYPSYWGAWGITMGLSTPGAPAFRPNGLDPLTPTQVLIATSLKILIIGTAFAIAWARRRSEPREVFSTLALSWLVFFAFAPGFGQQYLIWLAPFAAVASPRWFLALTVASSIFLFRFYSVISDPFPWTRGTSTRVLAPQWLTWGLLPWLVIVAWLVWWCASGTAARGKVGHSV
jgi:hypothetical protein